MQLDKYLPQGKGEGVDDREREAEGDDREVEEG